MIEEIKKPLLEMRDSINTEIINDLISNPNVNAIYMYGSRVYKSHNENSDHDYIIVTNDITIAAMFIGDDNFQFVSVDKFMYDLENHEVYAMECTFLPSDYILKGDTIKMKEIYPDKIRIKFCHTASNSWSKFKKKIDVENDIVTGLKSLFHSLRILRFAVDILKDNVIHYDEFRHTIHHIFQIADNTPKDKLVDVLSAKYRTVYNDLKTEIRTLAPTENYATLYNDIYALFDEFNVPRHKTLTKNIIKLFKDKK